MGRVAGLLLLVACHKGGPVPVKGETGESGDTPPVETGEEIDTGSGGGHTGDSTEDIPPGPDTGVEAGELHHVSLTCGGTLSGEAATACTAQLLGEDGTTRYRGALTATLEATRGIWPPKPRMLLQFQEDLDPLVSSGASWRFLDGGVEPEPGWTALAFDDSAWGEGPSPLGYGETDLLTTVGYGPDSSNKYATTWFRHRFTVEDPSAWVAVDLSVRRDDGIVVYVNGLEVFRDNMPEGTITGGTWAAANAADEFTWVGTSLSPAVLSAGENLVAAEVHQASGGSSDMTLDLSLQPSGGSLDVDLLATGQAEGWVLDGVWLDRSLLRTHLAWEVFRVMGQWAPASAFAEVSYGGASWGVFLLEEGIEALPQREGLEPGTAFVARFAGAGTGLLDSTWGEGAWELVWPPSPSEAEKSAFAVALGSMEAAVTAGMADSVLDLEDAADFVLLQEVLGNWEAYSTNLAVWRDGSGLFHLVPGDFHLSMGFPCGQDLVPAWNARPPWAEGLVASPGFRDQLAARWKVHREGPLSLSHLGRRVEAYAETLGNAPVDNFRAWPLEDVAYDPGWCPVDGWEEEVEELGRWLGERIAWVDDNLETF